MLSILRSLPLLALVKRPRCVVFFCNPLLVLEKTCLFPFHLDSFSHNVFPPLLAPLLARDFKGDKVYLFSLHLFRYLLSIHFMGCQSILSA